MNNVILIAFLTGLTTGGLSCFAVQGGLLTGSIAQRVEAAGGQSQKTIAGRRRTAKKNAAPFQTGMIQPIVLFMVAKLVVYTLLGFLLGALGSVFTFSPYVKGAIQLAIGIFLVGNALRMLNVHPIFRYFTFEPPHRLTRYIRQVSKRPALSGNGDSRFESWVTPLFLGALTVLIPCGVTQSVMAVAIGTGSPWLGAVIMFAFVLGTSPTFVGVSWLATNLGGMFQKHFYRVVAVVVLLLGLYTVDGGLILTGSPISSARLLRAMQPSIPVVAGAAAATASGEAAAPSKATATPFGAEVAALYGPEASLPGSQPVGTSEPELVLPMLGPSEPDPAGSVPAAAAGNEVVITVENWGYTPDNIVLPAGQPIKLRLVTNRTRSCSRAFAIPAMNRMEILPETGETVIELPPQAAGTTLDFMCSMGMYYGVMQFK